jgi:uncharacterized protein (UPF0548 family)
MSRPRILFRAVPDPEVVARLAASQQEAPFTYPAPGRTVASSGTPARDDTRVTLGQGEGVFRTASDAVRDLVPLRLGWVTPVVAPAVFPGEIVVVQASVVSWWVLAACRIVAVVDEDDGGIVRFGFAYGTLPAHPVRGEELFLVEFDRSSGEVTYAVRAVARPGRWWTRLSVPVLNRYRAMFRRDSCRAMLRAVSEPSG